MCPVHKKSSKTNDFASKEILLLFLRACIILNILNECFLLLKSQLVTVSYESVDQLVVSYKGVSYKNGLRVI